VPFDLLRALVDLVLPADCAGCGADGVALCASCTAVLAGPPRLVRPSPCPPGLLPLATVASYDGPARALLLAHKEHGRLGLSRPLGAALATAVVAASAEAPPQPTTAGPLVLVAMPSSAAARRARGYDHAQRLARSACSVLTAAGLACRVVPALRQERPVADQAGLGASARAANLAGALAVRRGAVGRLCGRIVLVDDVVTTGATLAEGARAVRAAGGRVLAAATVAATARRNEPDSSAGGALPLSGNGG